MFCNQCEQAAKGTACQIAREAPEKLSNDERLTDYPEKANKAITTANTFVQKHC